MGQVSGHNSAGPSALGYQWAVGRMLAELLSQLRLERGETSSPLRAVIGRIQFLVHCFTGGGGGGGVGVSGSGCLLVGICSQFPAVWSFPAGPYVLTGSGGEERLLTQTSDLRTLSMEVKSHHLSLVLLLKSKSRVLCDGRGPPRYPQQEDYDCHKQHCGTVKSTSLESDIDICLFLRI